MGACWAAGLLQKTGLAVGTAAHSSSTQLDTPLHPRQPVDRQSPALAQRHTDRVQAQAHTHAHTKWEVGVLALIFLSGSCSEARSLSGLAAAVLLLDQLISAKALTGLVFPGPPSE